MTTRLIMPGIVRTDRDEKRTYGYLVRMTRRRKRIFKFVSDSVYGGKRRALAAAHKHYRKLLRKHGTMTRRAIALLPRRKNSSGIVGVQKLVVRKPGRELIYWRAVWSPRPNIVRKQLFAVRLYGARRARALAIIARSKGLRSMVALATHRRKKPNC